MTTVLIILAVIGVAALAFRLGVHMAIVALGKSAAEWAATLVELDELRELRENTLLALGVNPILVADGTEDQSIAYLIEALKERVAGLEAS